MRWILKINQLRYSGHKQCKDHARYRQKLRFCQPKIYAGKCRPVMSCVLAKYFANTAQYSGITYHIYIFFGKLILKSFYGWVVGRWILDFYTASSIKYILFH